MTPGRICALAGVVLLACAAPACAPGAPAQEQRVESDLRETQATVGMRGRIENLRLPAAGLEVRPQELDAALVLRIVATWPHGTDTRYDLEYYGLEPGTYDLTDYLVRSDGTEPADLPAVEVTVTPVLPPGQVEPSPIEIARPPALGGYRTLLALAGAAWLAGLAALLILGRRKRAQLVLERAEEPPRTLAERLRPSVEAAMEGRLDESGKADLERLLVAHWRQRLDLGGEKSALALKKLKQHDEAGRLLRQLEVWLHSPRARAEASGVDLQSLLAPYRNVPAGRDIPADRDIPAGTARVSDRGGGA